MTESIRYQIGMPEHCRARAAELYEEAFRQKFLPIVKSREKLTQLLRCSIIPELAVVALNGDKLVGLAGFYHRGSSFTGGMSSSLIINHLGLLRGLWATAILGILYDRVVSGGELWMDGIVVDSEMRGRGIGSNILSKLIEFAKNEGYKAIKLEVIDTNNRARKLYESQGFKEVKTDHFSYLKPFFGFSASSTMVSDIDHRS